MCKYCYNLLITAMIYTKLKGCFMHLLELFSLRIYCVELSFADYRPKAANP